MFGVMEKQTKEIADAIRNKLDYNRFFRLVNDLGPACNLRKNRFDKADILEQALEKYCTEKILHWVDEVGYDHIYLPTQERIEVKSQKNSLYTEIGTPKGRTSSVKLTNTQGDASSREFPRRFDHLVIIDTGSPLSYSMGIVDYETAKKYVEHIGDGWVIRIPRYEITFICTPSDINLLKPAEGLGFDYHQQKSEMQLQYIEGVL
jgi:hypothetical protein